MTTEELVHALCEVAEENPCACLCEGCNQMGCVTPLLRAAYFKIDLQADKIKELEAKIPRWIPVTEQLPKDERPVLTFTGYADTPMIGFQQTQTYFCFDPNPHWQYGGFIMEGQSITHWMPLPETPEGGGLI